VVNTIIFALVLASIAVPMACCMEWKNVKTVAAIREHEKLEEVDNSNSIADGEKKV
jgi:hypothetical protein